MSELGFSDYKTYDDTTSTDALYVRWDFDGDSVFDTGWNTQKQASSMAISRLDNPDFQILDAN